jgi:NAD(P) transhydrogenase subunit alpha
MFAAASDPFLFRLAVFVLAVCAGWFAVSRNLRGHRQSFVLIAGLVAGVISSGAIRSVAILPAGEARSLAFAALLLASSGVVAGLLIARRRISAVTRRDP